MPCGGRTAWRWPAASGTRWTVVVSRCTASGAPAVLVEPNRSAVTTLPGRVARAGQRDRGLIQCGVAALAIPWSQADAEAVAAVG